MPAHNLKGFETCDITAGLDIEIDPEAHDQLSRFVQTEHVNNGHLKSWNTISMGNAGKKPTFCWLNSTILTAVAVIMFMESVYKYGATVICLFVSPGT